MKCWFDLTYKNPKRTLTKPQWKEIDTYRRKVRRIVAAQVDEQKVAEMFDELILYGESNVSVFPQEKDV